MVHSALKDSHLSSPHLLKTKLKTYTALSKTKSAYQIYLHSLALSGRSSMETLLKQSMLLLNHEGSAEEYNWDQLTFEKVHLVRSTLIDIGYSVNTVNLALSALKGVTKVAFNLGKMSADEMMRINSVKSLKGNAIRIGRRLTRIEIHQLLNSKNISISAKNTRDRALLSVGVGAGLRCAEICSLDLTDVDLEEGLITVRQGKGRKHRQIYLAQEILSNIKAWLEFRNTHEGALFTRIHKDGKIDMQRLSPSGLTHILKSFQQTCGVIPFSPHDMRRTFITQLLEDNVDLNTVRQLAGHSDISTTVTYDMRDLERQKIASQGLQI